MLNEGLNPILLERAMEQLRQEREAFEMRKAHAKKWFSLCLVMGYSAVVLLVGIMIVSAYILINSSSFSAPVVTSAGAALFVDVLGLLIGVWKIVLNPSYMTKLAPTTVIDLPDLHTTANEEAPTPAQPVEKKS